MRLENDEWCFVCGKNNPHGLKLRFKLVGPAVETSFKVERWMEGYPDIMHGGLIATVLDEVMGYTLIAKGILALTASLSVKYERPIRVGEIVKFKGEIVSNRRRAFKCRAVAQTDDGMIKARAEGIYIARGSLSQDLLEEIFEAKFVRDIGPK